MAEEEVYQRVVDVITRLRMVEENLENVMKRVLSFETGFVREVREIRDEIKEIKSKMMDIEKKLNEFDERLKTLENSLKDFARREDVKVIEKYIEFLNPSNYVTREEVLKMIKRYVGERK